MNREGRSAGRAALLLTLVAWTSGCSGDLGDFCQTDDDCTADLRCSAQPGQRGVCTYPEGVVRPQDAGAETAADGGADSGDSADAAMDVASDAHGADAAKDGTLDAADGATDGGSVDATVEGVNGDSAGDLG